MDESVIRKTPPHSEEAEMAVIGSILIDPEAVTTVMELLKPEDFYQKKYSIMFEAALGLYNENKPIDVQIMADRLKQKEAPAELFDIKFLRSLMNAVPTSANVDSYAKIVQRYALKRRLIKSCEAIADNCYVGREDTDAILADAEKRIFDISQGRGDSDYVSMAKVVVDSIKNIQAAAGNKGGVTGVATGFYDLDAKTAGMQPSDLILVAARPSMGKTAFVLNIAEHAAVKNGVPTTIFSLEMSKTQMANRILAMHSSVDAQKLRTGSL